MKINNLAHFQFEKLKKLTKILVVLLCCYKTSCSGPEFYAFKIARVLSY